MPADNQTIRYDTLVQNAMRGVIRHVLEIARDEGLPGEHHFYIVFNTQAPGAKISERLRQRYPSEMTIVLQHQFWDLHIHDTYFEVKLSFSGISEKLVVPFASIKAFVDPSVPYGFQLETDLELENGLYGSELFGGLGEPAPRSMSSRDHDGNRSLASSVEPELSAAVIPPVTSNDPELDEELLLEEKEDKKDSKIISLDVFRNKKDS